MWERGMWERVHHKAQAGNSAPATTQHNRQGPSACIYSIVQSAALSWHRSRIKIGKKKPNKKTGSPLHHQEQEVAKSIFLLHVTRLSKNWKYETECALSAVGQSSAGRRCVNGRLPQRPECFRLGKGCIQEVADSSNKTRKQNFIICLHITSANKAEGFAASFNYMSSAGGHWRSCEW